MALHKVKKQEVVNENTNVNHEEELEMALKSLTPAQIERREKEKKEKEMQKMNEQNMTNNNFIQNNNEGAYATQNYDYLKDTDSQQDTINEDMKVNSNIEETSVKEEKDEFFEEEQVENTNIYGNIAITEILKSSARKASIPEVDSKFKINHVTLEKNVATKNGIKDRISTDFHLMYQYDGEYKEAMLTQKYNVSNHPEANLQKKFLGKIREGGANIKCLNDLIGITGTAKIVHVTMDDGSVFENLQILTVSNN